MEPPIPPLFFALLLLVGMLILLETGRRLGIRRRPKESEGERSSLSAVEGAVFALFGLLMAFTFSGAATRFSEKRMLIAEEVNHIETAYLRLHLVPQESQVPLQDLFRRYLDSRLETYRRLPDMQAAAMEIAESKRLQEEIWAQAVAATRLPNSHPDAGKLLLPALNNMIDIATTRTMVLQMHPPESFMPSCSGWGLSVPCWLVIGCQAANTGVGSTFSGSRSSR
jgi:hypothetical protein